MSEEDTVWDIVDSEGDADRCSDTNGLQDATTKGGEEKPVATPLPKIPRMCKPGATAPDVPWWISCSLGASFHDARYLFTSSSMKCSIDFMSAAMT